MRKSVISAVIAMSAMSLTACGSSSSDSAKTTTTSVSSSTSVSAPTSSATTPSSTTSTTQTSSTTAAPSPTSTSVTQTPDTTTPVAPTHSTQSPAAAPATSSSSPKTSASPVASIQPNATLGLVGWGTSDSHKVGFGQVRPNSLDNGGDPTGILGNITWNSWGGKTATGTGMAEYVGPNQSVAEGHGESAKVVAYDLTTCGGHPAYRHVVWYFPQHGDTFQKAVAEGDEPYDLCNG